MTSTIVSSGPTPHSTTRASLAVALVYVRKVRAEAVGASDAATANKQSGGHPRSVEAEQTQQQPRAHAGERRCALLTRRHLYYTAIGLPAAALGVAIGVRLYRRIDQLLFNRLLVGAMLLIGTAYIAHSAVELLGVDRESVAWITSLYKAASDAEDDG